MKIFLRQAAIFISVLLLIIMGCTTKTPTARIALNDTIRSADTTEWDRMVKKADDANKANDRSTEKEAYDEVIAFLKKKDYPVVLFRTYAVFAKHAYLFGDLATGDKYLDSAQWVIDNYHIPELIPNLHLQYASKPQHEGKDSAIHYLKQAVADTTYLTDVELKVLYAELAETFLQKKYYKEAKFYTLKALALSQKETHEIKHFNNAAFYEYLYKCDLALKDTMAANKNLALAMQLMTDSLQDKGPATIFNSMADYYLTRNQYDSALVYIDRYKSLISESKETYQQTVPLVAKAAIYLKLKDYNKAAESISIAEKIAHPDDGRLLAGDRLNYYLAKAEISARNNNGNKAYHLLEKARAVEDSIHGEEKSAQLASMEERLTKARAEKTIAEKEAKINQQNSLLLSFTIAGILIAIIGILLFLNHRRKKLLEQQKNKEKEQLAIIEKTKLTMQAESDERNRISREIHDDIGPTLTSLNLAANMIKADANTITYNTAGAIISKNTSRLSGQMNEIIWSLNAGNDNLQSMVSFIRSFCVDFLKNTDIKLRFNSYMEHPQQPIPGYIRRNIYLTVKEVVNNAVKYSKASEIIIRINEEGKFLTIAVQDNGIGLPQNESLKAGNGIKNIKTNIEKISGTVMMNSQNGLNVTITTPLT